MRSVGQDIKFGVDNVDVIKKCLIFNQRAICARFGIISYHIVNFWYISINVATQFASEKSLIGNSCNFVTMRLGVAKANCSIVCQQQQ